MLELLRWLTPDEALRWMTERQLFPDPEELDVDPGLIAGGFKDSGAGLYRPSRSGSLIFDETRGGTIVEGDLVVDGPVENLGRVFVYGNLVCRGLINAGGYLVVAGDLVAERFLGIEESAATIALGNCQLDEAVLTIGHQLSTWGTQSIGELLDEDDDFEAVHQRLGAWATFAPGETFAFPWDAMRRRFSAWATAAAASTPLPTAWADRPFTPRLPPPPPPSRVAPALPALLAELQTWLESEALSQRQKLDELRTTWTARLSSLSPADLAIARRLVVKHVNSKKLVAARDELLSSWP